MKNLSKALRSKFAAVLFLLLTATPFLAPAQNNDLVKPEIVKYVGVIDNQFVFQFNYDNAAGEAFTITVRDEVGNLLYSGKFNDKKFSKQFRMDKTELGNSNLSFILTSQNDKQSQVFKVSTVSRVVDDVVVTKL